MAKELVATIKIEGFEDPLTAIVALEGFEDPLTALEKLKVFEEPLFMEIRFKGIRGMLPIRTLPD
jgi:hypothetical protein